MYNSGMDTKEYVKTLHIYLPPDLADYVRQRAGIERRPISWVMRDILESEIERAPLNEAKVPHKA